MAKTYDPLEGVTTKTPKEELMNRLRQAAAQLRRGDKARQATVAEITNRLIQKRGQNPPADLKQVICSATEEDWKDAVEFLEEFEHEELLPTALQRLVIGGRVLLQQREDANA